MLKKFSIHAGCAVFLCTVIYTVWKEEIKSSEVSEIQKRLKT